MKRKVLLVFVLIMVFGGIFVRNVEATCSTKKGIINENTDEVTFPGDVLNTDVGNTVCNAYSVVTEINVGFSLKDTFDLYYKLLVCGTDGEYDTVEDGCTACHDDGDGKAYCGTLDEKCRTYSGKGVSDGYVGCSGYDTYATCDGTTGDWINKKECAQNGYCEDTRWSYKCCVGICTDGVTGATANLGDIVCSESGNSIVKCESLGCTTTVFSLVESCDGGTCVTDAVDGPICSGDSNNLGVCVNVPNADGSGEIVKTLNANDGILPGKGYCYQNYKYTCDSATTFTLGNECTGDKPICYIDKTTGAATCGTETDAKKYGYVPTETTYNPANVYNPSGSCGSGYIQVASWCFPYDAPGIASKLLQIIFGIAGGIAFLLMVYGFIMVGTSSGDEKKLQAAKETITSAIVGLLVSLFALFLFRLIVVNILQIPGIS
jgi:hypothetical protein